MPGMTSFPLPHHESLPAHRHCTDYLADLDVGELAPGHRLRVRGICLYAGRLWLHYVWRPGITAAMGEDSGVWLTVEYHAGTACHADCDGSYDTSGGASSAGEIGYTRPPPGTRTVWFDLFATTDDSREHRVTRRTIDLATGRVTSADQDAAASGRSGQPGSASS